METELVPITYVYTAIAVSLVFMYLILIPIGVLGITSGILDNSPKMDPVIALLSPFMVLFAVLASPVTYALRIGLEYRKNKNV